MLAYSTRKKLINEYFRWLSKYSLSHTPYTFLEWLLIKEYIDEDKAEDDIEEITDTYDETKYEHFLQYGRISNIIKSIDCYSCVFERDNIIYVALSSGQVINAEKFAGLTDNAVRTWLTLLLNIRGIGIPKTT